MAVIRHYRVALFRGADDPDKDAPIEVREGTGKLPQSILIDGFSRTLEIELKPHWDKMQREDLCRLQALARTYETFVKFSDAVQQRRDYLVIFELEFKNMR